MKNGKYSVPHEGRDATVKETGTGASQERASSHIRSINDLASVWPRRWWASNSARQLVGHATWGPDERKSSKSNSVEHGPQVWDFQPCRSMWWKGDADCRTKRHCNLIGGRPGYGFWRALNWDKFWPKEEEA